MLPDWISSLTALRCGSDISGGGRDLAALSADDCVVDIDHHRTEVDHAAVARYLVKSLGRPDQTIRMPGVEADMVSLGDVTVGREVDAPGWRWSTDMRPLVGGEWCEANHVGVMISGRAGFLLRDGTEFEVGPDDVFDIPAGHDSWTIGDEPMVCIEWAGLRTWTGAAGAFDDRVLTTLVMSDLVESTTTAARVGDAAWRELLGSHYAAGRELIAEYHGRLVDTTGDGLFATFQSPVRAVRFADSLRRHAERAGLAIRVGCHTGEVELVGEGVRGLAVHEVARIMASAGANEVLVSNATRSLASDTLAFAERGQHTLKGFDSPRTLYAYG
jgi:class 3 adenylate cyclase